MENTPLKMGALMAGQIDVVVSTADEFTMYMKPNKPLKYLFATDISNGGDGIVAKDGIHSIADLKGKTVGYESGSVSQFFISALLREAKMRDSDIKAVNMTATDAGVAFAAGRLDAAVTWEPALSEAVEKGHGHILLDSSKRPGLIVDVAAVRADTAKQHQKELAALWRGWLRGLDYLKTHPDESYQIMAKGVGGWLNDPKLFADTTKGIKYLDQAGNRQLFGSAAAPGSLYKTLGYAMDIWREKGRLKVNAKPADIIDNSLVSK
jgi:NitT/TauT family transport system substrate-binding protein